MKIGELAEVLGVAPSAIRYYEKEGLIDPPMRHSGQRHFAPRAVQTLRFIQLAQAGGFSISEIKTLLLGYKGKPRLSDQWQVLAAQKKVEVRHQIDQLEQVDRVLDQLLKCDCATPEECVDRADKRKKSRKKTS